MEKEVKVKKRPTAKEFREQFGHSRTRSKLFAKHGVTSVEEYREIVKKRKASERKLSREKTDRAKAGKKVKVKK